MKIHWLRVDNWLDLLKHVFFIVILIVLAIMFLFYVYMPLSTSHGETVTVPDIVGMEFEEMKEFLDRRNLRFEVTEDSSFSPLYPAMAVLKQVPLPNTKVKQQRKIYITLNSSTPPMVRMPNLVEGSLKSAQMVLKTYDLLLGNIDYRPDLAFGAVLEQRMGGNPINPGDRIPKGSAIDLIVGDGLGNQSLEAPNLIGLDEESARIAIIGSGLDIGEVLYEKDNIAIIEETDASGVIVTRKLKLGPGEVTRQRPSTGTPMRLKQKMSLWIFTPDSTASSSSILDL